MLVDKPRPSWGWPSLEFAENPATCPVKALKAWLQAAGIADGALFRPIAKGGRVVAARLNDKSVADIVKAYARRVGLDAADFSGHSLRAFSVREIADLLLRLG